MGWPASLRIHGLHFSTEKKAVLQFEVLSLYSNDGEGGSAIE